MRYCLHNVYHSKIYRRWLYLSAGVQYIFETRDLRKTSSSSPDTYMYLVRDNQIVAKNDDHFGLASTIAYQPSVSGHYILVIRAYGRYTHGTCDVYLTTAGNTVKIDNNARFGGTPISARWKSDERLETRNASGDTYLLLIHGNTMLMDDDGGSGLHSKITPGYSGTGLVVVGSYSHSTRGHTSICNYYQSYLDNPGRDDEMDDPKYIISDRMVEFQKELMKYKAVLKETPLEKLVDITAQEHEERVTSLRDKILSEEEIKSFEITEPSVSEEYEIASKKYESLLEEAEEKLKPLSYLERATKMKEILRQKKEIFKNFIPQE